MVRYVIGLGIAAFVALSPPSQAGQLSYIPYCPPVVVHGKSRDGVASWYGKECQGNETASGESYNMNDLTAAHPNLPLGTTVRVTNLRNRRSLILRINDRGPFVRGRLLDVSRAAARRLGFSGEGTAFVRVEVVQLPSDNTFRLACPGARIIALN